MHVSNTSYDRYFFHVYILYYNIYDMPMYNTIIAM